MPLVDLAELVDLEVDANADGSTIVSRLIREWLDGSNRFSRTGEKAYVARQGERISAVCGLNVDPFIGSETVGRVRRMYVAADERRKGIGTAMMKRLMEDARGVYEWLRLRTHDPDAAAFYEAVGFSRVVGDEKCTHQRRMVA